MKIKTFHKTCLILCISITLFTGCDSWKTDLKADIDQESKDYCLFAQGSYWLYQDSATLKIDSTVVVGISYDKTTLATPTSPFLWEEYFIDMRFFLENNTYYDGRHILTSKYCKKYYVEAGINEPILLNYVRGIDEHYIENALYSTKYCKMRPYDDFFIMKATK